MRFNRQNLFAAAFGLLYLACSSPEKEAFSAQFVSHGILLNSPAENVSLTSENSKVSFTPERFGTQTLLRFAWTPEANYALKFGGNSHALRAPKYAQAAQFDFIDLEDASKLAAIGNFPDTDMQFDPSSRYFSVGTYYGTLRVYSLKEKRVLWKKKLSEGMAKRVHFSRDGNTTYVGEQSVDGFFYAFNTATGEEKWRYRLADDIDTSSPPRSDDMYGIYSLPAVFKIHVLEDNSVLVAGLHSWHDGTTYQRKSKLYKFSAEGAVLWSFPKEPLRGNIQHFDATSEFITFSVADIQKEFAASSKIKGSTVLLIDTKTGELLSQQKLAPLKPHFNAIRFWQSISIDPQNTFVTMGAYDGRGFHIPIKNRQLAAPVVNNFGTPIFADSVPIMAGISFTESIGGMGLYSVNQSSVPYSYSKENNISSPPMLHPASGSIFGVDAVGAIVWKHNDGLVYSAIDHSADELWLLATIDDKTENREKNLFGFSLFKRTSDIPFTKIYTYNSHVPSFFRGAISADGAFKAVVTAPFIKKKGDVPRGSYRVHIVM